MAEDERLREALLELQMLRDREAQVLEETKTLLDCLEAYSTAQDPSAALASIFMSLRQKIGAVLSMIVRRSDESSATIIAADARELLGQPLVAPFDLFERPRNIVDLSLLGDWGGAFDSIEAAGLVVSPIGENSALVSARGPGRGFRKQDLELVGRLSGLAVQALRNREISAEKELLAATISGSSSGFAISDATQPEQPLIYVNAAFEALSGYRADEVLGQNCRFLSAEAPDAPERVRLRAAVEAKTGGKFLLRNRRKSGELFWNELTLYPVKDETGQTRNLVATQSDVSARVEAAQERDQVRARMSRALSATDDAYLVLETDGRVAFSNAAVPRFFPAPGSDWKVDTTFEENWAHYLEECEDLPGRITALLRRPDLDGLVAGGSGHEVDLPDGRTVFFRGRQLEDGGRVLTATDITALKSAQFLLSQRLAAIEAAPDGIAIADSDGRLMYVNSSAARLLGYLAGTRGLGQKWQDQYVGSPTFADGPSFEVTLDRKNTEHTSKHEITGSPLENGGTILVIRDITESLANEAREAEMMNELTRLQRQEALAQLTAGVAHDFNNLLSAINGSATLIGMLDGVPEQVRPHLERILAAGNESSKLISRLLDIGANTDAEGVFDLSSVLKALPSVLGANVPKNISVTFSMDTPALVLRGAPGTLTQILLNIVLNARDAIGDTMGSITLRAFEAEVPNAGKLATGMLDDAARYAAISVTDDGTGMTEDVLARAFQPFFTTKGRHGTGLGLATAALQIKSVGGAISIDSEDGVGTTITVFWPVHVSKPGADQLEGSGSTDLAGRTVIVVDDDANVASVISHFLEAQGAEVAICEDPRDAVVAITEDPSGWSALITDYDMPIMNGGVLVEKVRGSAPSIPIFVVTALAKRLSDPRVGPESVAGIFSKPIDLEGLSRALASATTKR